MRAFYPSIRHQSDLYHQLRTNVLSSLRHSSSYPLVFSGRVQHPLDSKKVFARYKKKTSGLTYFRICATRVHILWFSREVVSQVVTVQFRRFAKRLHCDTHDEWLCHSWQSLCHESWVSQCSDTSHESWVSQCSDTQLHMGYIAILIMGIAM